MSISNGHGWLQTGTLPTRFGDFEFSGGYPVGDSGDRLLEQLRFNRAVEVYLTQLMRVSEIATREGMRAFGSRSPQQLVIWEDLMGPDTVLLTANTETVYALAHLRLKTDGPTVIEAPPAVLGFVQDGLQRYLGDIGMLGPDQGRGGNYLVLPPGYDGEVPDGYFVMRSPTYSALFAIRGFQVDAGTDKPVAAMKQTRIYPLSQADSPPPMEFLNGSHRPIDTVFPDTARYFDLLAMLVEEEPAELFDPLERFQMQAIGIEKGRPFDPDPAERALLDEAAQVGGAMARANTYRQREDYYYPGRHWQGVSGLDYTFTVDGIPQIDSRDDVYYMAAGNSPAMMAKNVGRGSQYLWTWWDADGNHLQGEGSYRLHVPAGIPVENFWSVVVYDAVSRSELQNGQPLPSVSSYTDPIVNDDGSVDITFSPEQPAVEGNWIRTVSGRGWFGMFRFYSPTEEYFDKSWQLDDIVRA
ncbi:hypothetical protein NONO_c61940 [Nocardia nova SH22a]|uniref:DUF1254 domain-containing protein n=1 Tax=Nocardia nova SH22a TaxID=1415166 RepID=W5TNN3_9NOCA|nr:DUF1254 domain-containing protein [Nocardia nova]AHH20965.1 hypothetical protein NONO_c61940 [Nocardia nova SH22a]